MRQLQPLSTSNKSLQVKSITDGIQLLKSVLGDFENYASNFLYIIHRDTGQVIPFKLKPIQRKIVQAIQKAQKTGKRTVIAVLKARQMGCSTSIGGLGFYRTITRPFHTTLVVSHRGDSLRLIADIYERFYEMLPPEFAGFKIKPRRRGTKYKEIHFPEIDSKIMFLSARGDEVGRSGFARFIHLSECAFYPDLKGLLSTITAQVPVQSDGIIVLESTSAGPDNEFAEIFLRAQKGESEVMPLFFAWFEDPDYRLVGYDVPEEERDEEERWLVKQFGLDGEQLAWRRWKISVDCSGDVDLFRREYPATVEDCLTLIGDKAWSREVLEGVFDIKPPIWRGHFTSSGKVDDPTGPFKIWEEPMPDVDYVVGVDTAEGLSEGHPSAVEVFRVGRHGEYPVQVAEWWGHIDPLGLALVVSLIGLYYNKALVSVEINNTGLATQGALQKIYFYPRLHRWTPWDSYKSRSDKWGWQTTAHSRQIMLSVTDWLIRNKKIVIRSKDLAEELMYFQNVGGDYQGIKGDDRIDAMMIAFVSWFQHIFRGVKMKELKDAIIKYYSKDITVKGVVKNEGTIVRKKWWHEVLPENSDGWY